MHTLIFNDHVVIKQKNYEQNKIFNIALTTYICMYIKCCENNYSLYHDMLFLHDIYIAMTYVPVCTYKVPCICSHQLLQGMACSSLD